MRPQPEPAGPGCESVWDFPRPPRIEPCSRHLDIVLGGVVIAATTAALRVLETSHPPVYYLPADAFVPGAIVASQRASYCEFKGAAAYADLRAGDVVARDAAWTYPGHPRLDGHYAVYAGRVDACHVDGETVIPQPGEFYGGWITRDLAGPFKGGPGTTGW